MRFYLDTEFIEYPCTIDLISIGIVSEDGHEFYAESREFDESKASQWVKDNVIAKLWCLQRNRFADYASTGGYGGYWRRDQIREGIKTFINECCVTNTDPEFWGYFADYDWVAFCWLFGAMIDLPKGWPFYCRDIKQLADSMGIRRESLPEQKEDEHVALADARWNRRAHNVLRSLSR